MRSNSKPEDRDRPRDLEDSTRDRGGVLLRNELVETGAGSRPQVRPSLVIAFIRALIQNTTSGDLIALSLYRARDESGASEEEVQMLTEAIRAERPLCNRSDMFPHL